MASLYDQFHVWLHVFSSIIFRSYKVTCMFFVGNVNQRMEKLESSQQSTYDKVHHLQGDYSNFLFFIDRKCMSFNLSRKALTNIFQLNVENNFNTQLITCHEFVFLRVHNLKVMGLIKFIMFLF